jgi:hypothetical protein
MGKIITASALNSANGPQEFSVKRLPLGDTKFSMNGNLEVIIDMLYRAMEADGNAAKTLVTTVLVFADQKKISLEDLKKHSFLSDGKIQPR